MEERDFKIRLSNDAEVQVLTFKAWDVRHEDGTLLVIGTDGGMVAAFGAGSWKWFSLADFQAELKD